MTSVETALTKKQYQDEGYCIFRNVLDEALLAEAREHIDWLCRKFPDTRPENLDFWAMEGDAFWVRLVADDRLLDVAQEFIGPDIALFASHYIAKRPLDGKAVPWHQDGSYWPLDPMEVVTLWVSLDRADAENGCMKVLPGTQELKLMSSEDYVAQDETMLFDKAMDASTIDESQAVDIVLQPGDVEVHHPNVIHGSHPNHSDRWRRGLTIRYIPAGTKILEQGFKPSAFFLRGNPRPGVNRYNAWPKFEAGKTMEFAGAEEWNRLADQNNARWSSVID